MSLLSSHLKDTNCFMKMAVERGLGTKEIMEHLGDIPIKLPMTVSEEYLENSCWIMWMASTRPATSMHRRAASRS